MLLEMLRLCMCACVCRYAYNTNLYDLLIKYLILFVVFLVFTLIH